MPTYCCVPGCKSTYTSANVFRFPKNESMKKTWIDAIPRKDLAKDIVVSKDSVVCSLHFAKDDILREDILRSDGLPVKRRRVTLSKKAYPTLFPGLPARPLPRTDPDLRLTRFDEAQENLFLEDKVTSIFDIINNIGKINMKSWHFLSENTRILFFKLTPQGSVPQIEKSFFVNSNLSVEIFVDGKVISIKAAKSFLGKDFKCNLFSKVEHLITFLDSKEITVMDLQDNILNDLNKLIENDVNSSLKLKFIYSQLLILFSGRVRYTADDILLFSLFHYTFPAAYRYLREKNVLTMPHPSYIKSFSTDNLDTGVAEKYLKQKFNLLKPDERFVAVLLDKIYIKKNIAYKGNRMEGFAQNTDDPNPQPATTVQAFMITSVLSKNKDVVGLYPVKNLDVSFLYSTTLQILEILHRVGYEVVAVISDKNRVNRKAFQEFSPTKQLQLFIESPFLPGKKIFFLFDPVHLFKCIRNNWINEKFQTFLIPSMSDDETLSVAEFSVLKSIYEKERLRSTKLAPSLTWKALFPSGLERQNVSLVAKIFNEKNIEAIKKYYPSAVGTIEFMEIILKWWTIVNVKHLKKGHHLRDPNAVPIDNYEQSSYTFLSDFTQWLTVWETSEKSKQKLTSETHSALIHTTAAFVYLVRYLKDNLKFNCVLLGKFQIDPLEYRFGEFSQMSGTNNHVSLQQILVSEKKIRISSFLKLKSKQTGDFQIRDLFIGEDTELEISDDLQIDNIISMSHDVQIDEASIESVVFVSGYVARKISEIVKCVHCSSLLFSDQNLDSDCNHVYFLNLDRGGLKYPSQFSLDMGVYAYKVFQTIISDNFEQYFLAQTFQKRFLFSAITKYYDEAFTESYVCACGQNSDLLAKKAASIWSNIFLNNYTKNLNGSGSFNDQSRRRKARKLQ